MKKEDLFEAIGDLDDELIKEAERPVKRARNWKIWGAIAACLCLAVIMIGLQKISGPSETPLGQGYFNATVLELYDDAVLVQCTENTFRDIPVGARVWVSLRTLSDEPVPALRVGDPVRVLHMGANTAADPITLRDTVSIFLLDKNGVPII